MKYTRWLQEIKREHIAEVGTKAASLSELVSLGVNVPPGFVVTTEAYRRFLSSPRLHKDVDRFVAESRSLTLPEVGSRTKLLRRAILRHPVPQAIVNDVKQTYHELSDLIGPEASSVCVRSSATSEDLAEASFAGIHSSFLNISGIHELIASIKRCWASLWSADAVTYRTRCGFDHSRVSMGVIVQQMIPANVSGVMFTCNPVTGARSEIVINSCWGLGESVVSGRVTPDIAIIDKPTFQTLEKNSGTKELVILPKKKGGVRKVRISRDHAKRYSLTDEQTRQLAKLGLWIEERFRWPQDVEWVIAGNDLFVVQSRPVSMLLSRNDLWLHRSPAQISLDKAVIEKKLIPRRLKKNKNRMALYRGAANLGVDWENTILPSLIEEIRAIEQVDFQSMSNFEFASRFQEIISANRRHFQVRVRVSQLIDASVEWLSSYLKGLNFLSPEEYPRLLSKFTGKTVESDLRLWELALRASPRIIDVLRRGSGALNELKSWEEGARWLKEFDRYLDEFGHLSPAKWDIMAPTYREDPEVMLNTILNYASIQTSALRNVSALSREQETLIENALEAIPNEKRSSFLKVLKIAQTNYPIKDNRDFYYLRSLAQVRRAFKEAGSRLQKKGLLRSIDDVFFLYADDIPDLIRSDAVNSEDIQRKIRARKLKFNEREAASTSGVVEAIKYKYLFTNKDSLVLKGIGTSPGISSGRAKTLRSLHEFPRLKKGDILVCPATTPAWAPVFSIARGLVTDVGGILSHGGILAREFRIPAVVSTGIGTKIIKNGQQIIVDGSKGLVYMPSRSKK